MGKWENGSVSESLFATHLFAFADAPLLASVLGFHPLPTGQTQPKSHPHSADTPQINQVPTQTPSLSDGSRLLAGPDFLEPAVAVPGCGSGPGSGHGSWDVIAGTMTSIVSDCWERDIASWYAEGF